MAIPEEQLTVWSHPGPSGPSRDTYQAVKGVLEDPKAPFADKSPDIFLQGSYGNDTNVARDSDVDVVALISTTFAHDANTMATDSYQAFERAYPGTADYSYQQYKADVADWLITRFGKGVTPGKKAIFIPAGQNRRDCDVVPAIEYRYYLRFSTTTDQSYISGICFYLPDGTQIINYPKQHSKNCTEKHQQTGSWFKPTVRIYKNMRNYMLAHNLIEEGLAPSYFIEGMLYNVPNDMFGKSFRDTLVATYDFIVRADRTEFRCANQIHKLLGDTPVTWRAEDCQTFLTAMLKLWSEWR
ncbi:nucleotidyltransferase domain-containing protein [Rhizobium leguminosarum]|uniref:nucleotidyltransferase domain-containing protein n=1 Tax=Rhizobium leguminosarum TaxID=384 RepID=UPI003F97918B